VTLLLKDDVGLDTVLVVVAGLTVPVVVDVGLVGEGYLSLNLNPYLLDEELILLGVIVGFLIGDALLGVEVAFFMS
jgi:hypothetical protein